MIEANALWLTRDAADALAANARRAALEQLSSAFPAWPADRQEALLRAAQALWGASATTASGLLANNAKAISAAYSLRPQLAGLLLVTSPNAPMVPIGITTPRVGAQMNGLGCYWIDFDMLEDQK